MTVKGSASIGAPLCWEFYQCSLVYFLSYFKYNLSFPKTELRGLIKSALLRSRLIEVFHECILLHS